VVQAKFPDAGLTRNSSLQIHGIIHKLMHDVPSIELFQLGDNDTTAKQPKI